VAARPRRGVAVTPKCAMCRMSAIDRTGSVPPAGIQTLRASGITAVELAAANGPDNAAPRSE
jgi:hypothetical protein